MRVEGKSLSCLSELVGVVDSRYLPSARSMHADSYNFFFHNPLHMCVV